MSKALKAQRDEPRRVVLDLDRYVPALINFISNKLSRGASSLYLKTFGVGVTEWRIMSLLAIEGAISVNRIAHVIGFDKGLISRTVQALEKRDIVSTAPDEQDGRRHTISLTPVGLALHDRIIQVALERERRLLADFSPAEIDTLIDLLKRMHAQIPHVNEYDPEG
jgi:DNA-binding MarR family transcriptional regulator